MQSLIHISLLLIKTPLLLPISIAFIEHSKRILYSHLPSVTTALGNTGMLITVGLLININADRCCASMVWVDQLKFQQCLPDWLFKNDAQMIFEAVASVRYWGKNLSAAFVQRVFSPPTVFVYRVFSLSNIFVHRVFSLSTVFVYRLFPLSTILISRVFCYQ